MIRRRDKVPMTIDAQPIGGQDAKVVCETVKVNNEYGPAYAMWYLEHFLWLVCSGYALVTH